MINKDTLLFGSFAKEAGNTGCRLFNTAFKYYGIDAIYKSFSVNDIEGAVSAARTLNFKGFAVTMPFKRKVLDYVDEVDSDVEKIGAANTIIKKDGNLVAYNTDFLAAKEFLYNNYFFTRLLYILGDGGYAASVKHAATSRGINFILITRKNWGMINTLRHSLIYNCTPVVNEVHESNKYIDCSVTTETGKELALIQASYQFKLYTGKEFPFKTGGIK